jgi:ATP-dependent helicase/nuclease subunit B
LTLIPYGEDPLRHVARRIVQRCGDRLPLLDGVTIVVPDMQAAPRLREQLLAEAATQGHQALLGPHITTLRDLTNAVNLPSLPPVLDAGRELMLVEALQAHRSLFGESNAWRLCDSLMQLFDELTVHRVQLPEDLERFTRLLEQGYGITSGAPGNLGQEARLIHTLWHAWHTQMAAEGYIDPQTAHVLKLIHAAGHVPADALFVVVGFTRFTGTEAEWLTQLLNRGQAEVVLHGTAGHTGYHPDAVLTDAVTSLGLIPAQAPPVAAFSAFLDAVFPHDQDALGTRAHAFATLHTASPASARLRLLGADDSELEAQAVDLQVRRWLLAGKRHIGIVTEDRRLARRIRALLERAGVDLTDTGGWALSTTSAATALERWLESIEEDFAHQPLLDLLKSPFLRPEEPDAQERFRHAVFRLEQDIIRHENIARGLNRYRQHVTYRAERLGWSSAATAELLDLLGLLEEAAAPVKAVCDRRRRSPLDFLGALEDSLRHLGAWARLEQDAAGDRVLMQLDRLRTAAASRDLPMTWMEFRGWLGRNLEQATFRPATAHQPVQLLTLAQSRLCRFDGLIIAGAERDHLPGRDARSPYFNDAVRGELGLPVWQDSLNERLHHFRRLLEAAPEVLITRRREQDGEEIMASPWVEALQAFHYIAYGTGLDDGELLELLANPGSQVFVGDTTRRPQPRPFPRPQLPAAQVPSTVSVAAHQRLINCPYQFFGAVGLGLKPPEEVREALEKSDYGERVHRCLQAFYAPVAGLPEPFAQALTDASREAAIAHLTAIAQAQFGRDLEDNFMHRGWLKRWLALIPAYIDWEIARQQQWRVQDVELAAESRVGTGHALKGRLDRVDTDADGGHAVLDYKTGGVPTPAEVESGEAVQLPSYALLVGGAQRVEYLKLDSGVVASIAPLEGAPLQDLAAQVALRLETMLDELGHGAALPAWGDDRTCAYCDMEGLCRRQAWSEPASAE